MKQNPWATVLGTIGVLGLIVAAVTFFIANGMGLDGLVLLSFSQWLGQFAGFAFVGFLLYEAFEWFTVERGRAQAEARRRAAAPVKPME
ncbi:MAG: hypothetical protein ACRDT9_11160 [Agromyces sp.]